MGGARGAAVKGAPSPGNKAARKAKLIKDRAKRMQALWGQCATVAKQVKVNKYSWPFHKPVDWKALNLPDYPTIVKNPMDLHTVTEKLGGVDAKGDRTYQTPLQMREDMRLIFDNCRLYNQPGQDVRIMGDMLSDHFEKRWQNSNIEGKWLMECEIQKYEDEELAQIQAGTWGKTGGGDASPGGVSRAPSAPMPMPIAQPLAAAVPASAPAAPALQPADAVAPVAGSSGRGSMPFEQKRKLSVALGQLPPEKLVQVVEIVKRRATLGGDDGSDEIELDMETLDSETLWELDDYVNQCKKKKVPPPFPSQPSAPCLRVGRRSCWDLPVGYAGFVLDATQPAPPTPPDLAAPLPAPTQQSHVSFTPFTPDQSVPSKDLHAVSGDEAHSG